MFCAVVCSAVACVVDRMTAVDVAVAEAADDDDEDDADDESVDDDEDMSRSSSLSARHSLDASSTMLRGDEVVSHSFSSFLSKML